MRGFRKTKDEQLIKVCMLLAACEPEPRLLLTKELFELGLAWFDSIEANMSELSVAAGRNELALPQQRILDMINSNGGMLQETKILIETSKDLNPAEQWTVLRHLENTYQVHKASLSPNGSVSKIFYVAHWRWAEGIKKGEFKVTSQSRPSLGSAGPQTLSHLPPPV